MPTITVRVQGSIGRQTYEVSLSPDGNHKVYVLTKKKRLARGYHYAEGADVTRRTIKQSSQIWCRAVKQAQEAANNQN